MQEYRMATAMALLAGLGLAVGAGPASAQQTTSCDQDGNGYVSAAEADQCADRDYSTIVGDQPSLSRERFGRALGQRDDADQMWTEADADGDGQVTRQEWAAWRSRGFSEATEGAEQGMASNLWNRYAPEFRSDDETHGGSTDSSGNAVGSAGGESAGAGVNGGASVGSDGSSDQTGTSAAASPDSSDGADGNSGSGSSGGGGRGNN